MQSRVKTSELNSFGSRLSEFYKTTEFKQEKLAVSLTRLHDQTHQLVLRMRY